MASPPRPHPLARARSAIWADRAVQALWDGGVTAKPPLEPEFLWSIGSRGFDSEDEHAGRSEAEVEDCSPHWVRLAVRIGSGLLHGLWLL